MKFCTRHPTVRAAWKMKRCLSPLGCRRHRLLPWGPTAKGLGGRGGESATVSTQSSWGKPAACHSWAWLQTVLPCSRCRHGTLLGPKSVYYTGVSLDMVPMTWIFSPIGNLYLHNAIPVLSTIFTVPMVTTPRSNIRLLWKVQKIMKKRLWKNPV